MVIVIIDQPGFVFNNKYKHALGDQVGKASGS